MKIWLDCDPGHDDVVAILVAAGMRDRLELVGISTVAGNAPVEATTHNALVTAELFDLAVEVSRGCDRPLVRSPVFAANIHGTSGLDGPVLPPRTREPTATHGVLAMIEATQRHDGLWLVPTGPLTNVALAMRLDPQLSERIAGISLMGGGPTFGNTTPWAEFNIWADPEAAAIVFASGVPLRMCGLNVTHDVVVGEREVEAFRSRVDAPRAQFLAGLMEHFATAYRHVFFDTALGPLHDPCAVLALSHPELFRFVPRHVEIELAGQHTRGMTVVDRRDVKGAAPANCEVAEAVDGAAARQLILDVLDSYVEGSR